LTFRKKPQRPLAHPQAGKDIAAKNVYNIITVRAAVAVVSPGD